MKKILLLSMLVAFGTITSNAQTKAKSTTKKAKTENAASSKVITPVVDGAGMLFENETIQ